MTELHDDEDWVWDFNFDEWRLVKKDPAEKLVVPPEIEILWNKNFHDFTKSERQTFLRFAEAVEWKIPTVCCVGCGHKGEHSDLHLVNVTYDVEKPNKPFGEPVEKKYVCEDCLNKYDAACREAERESDNNL